METDDDVTGPVNLGDPGDFTIAQLAVMVIEMTSARSKIVYRDLLPELL